MAKNEKPTISITLEPLRVVRIRNGRKPRIYHNERSRQKLVAFAVERGWKRSETQVGVIYRNWL